MIKRGYRTLFVLALGCAADGALGHGPWRAHEGNVPGWQHLSPAERIALQARVRGFRTQGDCRPHLEAHQRLVALRTHAGDPEENARRDFCAHLPSGTGQP